jgi:hypothetical protein
VADNIFRTEPCRSCDASIIWCTTGSKSMPVNAEPERGGNLALEPTQGTPRVRVVDAKHAFGRTDLRKSHFATCPQASTWRRNRSTP